MSWNIKVAGNSKKDCLKTLNDEVYNGQQAAHIEPKAAVMAAAHVMCSHMGEEGVRSITSMGHTNDNGLSCTISISINY